MDIFAHAVWTNVVYYKKYRTEVMNRWISIFFGIMPDLISFTPVFLYSRILKVDFFELIGRNIWPVKFASLSYNYTHSLIVFLAVFAIVGLTRSRKSLKFIYWPMFGWMLHILIDIFTHKGFYETPFLFPLSNYKFTHGVSWGQPTFMIINYSALSFIYLFWFLILRRREFQKQPKEKIAKT